MLGKKYIPIIHIRSTLNSQRTQRIIQKIQSASKMNNGGFAIVVDIPNQMPVQVDHIAQTLRKVRQKYHYPIYGFTTSSCSAQSYYLLSVATRIYTYPTTIFTFRQQLRRISYDSILNTLGIHKNVSMSQPNLLGKSIDAFTSPFSGKYGNHKETDLTERLIKYGLENRLEVINEDEQKIKTKIEIVKEIQGLQRNKQEFYDLFRPQQNKKYKKNGFGKDGNLSEEQQLQKIQDQIRNQANIEFKRNKKAPQYPESSICMGKQVVEDRNLVDGFGSFQQILKKMHPDCEPFPIQYSKEDYAVGKIIAIITSPFLVLLFLFKVVLKYSIIMYLYLRAKAKGEEKSLQQLEKQAEEALD